LKLKFKLISTFFFLANEKLLFSRPPELAQRKRYVAALLQHHIKTLKVALFGATPEVMHLLQIRRIQNSEQ
jgi:hypothetical protein